MTPRLLNTDFHCVHCGRLVLALHALCGVNNRNHCPWCLWSRHLDLYAAGDRLSACKSPMRPVGLSMKPGRNRYAHSSGEFMLVHACVECGRLSINRIAADDDSSTLLEVFASSFVLPSWMLERLFTSGIRLLSRDESRLVSTRLLGSSQPLTLRPPAMP